MGETWNRIHLEAKKKKILQLWNLQEQTSIVFPNSLKGVFFNPSVRPISPLGPAVARILLRYFRENPYPLLLITTLSDSSSHPWYPGLLFLRIRLILTFSLNESLDLPASWLSIYTCPTCSQNGAWLLSPLRIPQWLKYLLLKLLRVYFFVLFFSL